IYGQRYNASGVAQGTEFKVNATTTVYDYFESKVAMADNGDFIVSWTNAYLIFVKRYSANGVPKENQFTVATSSTASIAVDSDGGFMVVWSTDSPSPGVYVKRYDNA